VNSRPSYDDLQLLATYLHLGNIHRIDSGKVVNASMQILHEENNAYDRHDSIRQKRRRRDYLKSKGLCTECGKRKTRQTNICSVCREKKQHQQQRRENND